jgi:NAD(P)-dependent dehydrogenase (short-subunit alcohol dehydrogenase family)
MDELSDSGHLPELFILNAGINRVDNDETFELAAFTEVLETNLYGVLNFIEPLTRLAVGAPRQVIAVGSLASFVGNPHGLGYHVSKRALASCFSVWSKMYANTDLTFQQVLLGPVSTPIFTMASEQPRWMVNIRDLASVSASAAAEAIAALAKTRRAASVYPLRAIPLYLGMAFCQRFVPGVFDGRKTLLGRHRRKSSSQ